MKILIFLLLLISMEIKSQSIINEIATISETNCDDYFPICFLRDNDDYRVLKNKNHWYWRNFKHSEKDEVSLLITKMIDNLEKIKKDTLKKQSTYTRNILVDECSNYILYLNHFYDKIDVENRRRYRNI